MRFFFAFFMLITAQFMSAQTVMSPDQFLGYSLGSAFTEHYKVVNYIKYLSETVSSKMKLEQYGSTNEGKTLLIAIVSAEDNIRNINQIRKNNLSLTGLIDGTDGNPDLPSIVWLSYNVHGNEASSTEVAMKLLYEMVSGNNQKLNEWLKHTVVIVDPCLNPDGRDRYVNWFNQTKGSVAVENPYAREHSEPWPGGRTNHYNFDLNRDWAWQTQTESAQRMVKYNEWMPEIHCDFHEQYPANPYYFAPAAEPFHEVITPWQRDFQTKIGKNHAAYFDAKGWLYFTKEVFDLFYPSYGDTYPLFNGSIGMTYEQAGHSRGGLTIEVNDDTLTLFDRIEHHYTTSISTIQMAAMHYKELNRSFKSYFDNTKKNGAGPYKCFILKANNSKKTASLIEFFNKNNIKYAFLKKGLNIKGISYESGKEEPYLSAQGDMMISTFQTKGSLVKVLFEPQSKLSDSVTYDITAWSLPYVFGIDGFAVKEQLQSEFIETIQYSNLKQVQTNQYAYLIEYNAFSDAKLLAALIQKGIKVRFAERDFSFAGKKYNKGTLIVLQHANLKQMDSFHTLINKQEVAVTAVTSGFMDTGFDFGSEKIHRIKKMNVALLTGNQSSSAAAGEIWHYFDKQLQYPICLINANDLSADALKSFDVLIIPDGDYRLLNDKDCFLKPWVRQGGKIIAIDGAVQQMASSDWGIKLKKEGEPSDTKALTLKELPRYENRERESIESNIPGAIYKLNLDDSHPLAFGYGNSYFTLKLNANVLEYSNEIWNVGALSNENQTAGFVGNKLKAKIKEGTVIAVQEMGSGSVVYFTDDPIFRSFWENGKLLLFNAVFLVGQ
jgi:hypothetical protein